MIVAALVLIVNFLRMNSKSLLIAIAAFAVTATGAQAFVGGDVLRRAGLSEDQVAALSAARNLRAEGEVVKARDVLVKAGIDESALASVREAVHKAREAMYKALREGDYEAFKESIRDTPLSDLITSKDDFDQFKKAHELRVAGEHAEAKVIFDDLGVMPPMGRGMGFAHYRHTPNHEARGLTTEQREALQVARQANDRETVHAILEEAGMRGGMKESW